MKDAKGHGSNKRGGSMPLEGHPYHQKSDAELRFIAKDANEAAQNMRGFDPQAESKYLDQVNDASTVLGYRQRVSDAQAAAALAQGGAKSAPVPVHSGAAGRNDADLIRYHQGRADFYFRQAGRFGRKSDLKNFQKHDSAVRSLMTAKG